jgi:Family of unknown function (DUF6328)
MVWNSFDGVQSLPHGRQMRNSGCELHNGCLPGTGEIRACTRVFSGAESQEELMQVSRRNANHGARNPSGHLRWIGNSGEVTCRSARSAGTSSSAEDMEPVPSCRTCSAGEAHDRWNAGVRGETPLQRADRAYGEILQEVRVAQTGVQILFAFLLTLAFTARFRSVTQFERDIYVVTLMLAAGASALLIAPAAFHRVVYRRRLKQHLVHIANMLALAGLVLLLLAMIAALLLILDVVTGIGPAVILASAMLAWFFTWWFILPVCSRLRHSASAGTGK